MGTHIHYFTVAYTFASNANKIKCYVKLTKRLTTAFHYLYIINISTGLIVLEIREVFKKDLILNL